MFIDPPYNTGSAFTHYDDGVEHSIFCSAALNVASTPYKSSIQTLRPLRGQPPGDIEPE